MNSKGNFVIPKGQELDIIKASKELALITDFNLEKTDASFYCLQFRLIGATIRVYSNGGFLVYRLISEKHKCKVERKLDLYWKNFLSQYLKKS